MKITAVIPVRAGSQRVKGKNFRPFGDTTLLELKIRTLLQVPELDAIIVNTNSDDAIRIVENYPDGQGKLSWQRREEYYAASGCGVSDFFEHLGKTTDTDIFVHTPCTSPLIKPETISQCIRLYLDSKDCDCVTTVIGVREFLWQDGRALNYDTLDAPNSQDLPDIVALSFGATVISREDLIKNRYIVGQRPKFVRVQELEALDIDTPLDFHIAEMLYLEEKAKENAA